MTLSKICAGSALFLLAACSFQGPEAGPSSEDNAKASFSATTVRLKDSRTTEYAAGIPKLKVFEFESCLIDRATTLPLRNLDVVVSGAEHPIAATADPAGCFHWEETVEYRHLAPEYRLSWPRSFEVRGAGKYVARLVLDPWKKDHVAQALADYTLRPLPADVLPVSEVTKSRFGEDDYAPRLAAEKMKQSSNWRAREVRVDRKRVGVGKFGTKYEFRVGLNLVTGRKILGDTWIWGDLQEQGKLTVRFRLLEKHGKDSLTPLSKEHTVSSVEINRGWAEFVEEVEYNDRLDPNTSEVYLKYSLETEDPASMLLPAEEWFLLGKNTSTRGTPVSEAPSGRSVARTARRGSPGFSISKVDVTPFQIGPKHDWTMPVGVSVEVCLATADENEAIAGADLDQFTFDLTSHPIPTADSAVSASSVSGSCFTIRYEKAVEYFLGQMERQEPKYLHIFGKAAPYEGVVLSRPIAINPWQHARPKLFFTDLGKVGGPSAKIPAAALGKKVSIDVTGGTSEFLGKTYEVNRNLQQLAIRKFHVTLNPSLRIPYQLHTGKAGAEPVPEGATFRVHGVFTTMPGNEYLADFVSPFTMADENSAEGTILLPVEFAEQPRLRGAVRLLLHLMPLPQKATGRPEPSTIELSFQPTASSAGHIDKLQVLRHNVPYTEFLAAIPSVGQKLRAGEPTRFEGKEESIDRAPSIRKFADDLWGLSPRVTEEPIELFARYAGQAGPLTRVHLNDGKKKDPWTAWEPNGKAPEALPAWDRAAISKALRRNAFSVARDVPPSFVAGLCATYTGVDADARKKCETEPGLYFDASAVVVCDEAKPDPDAGAERPADERISVQATYFKEVGYQERVTNGSKTAHQATVGVQAKYGVEVIGLGGGAFGSIQTSNESFSTTEIGVTAGMRSRVGHQVTRDLIARTFPLRLIASVHSCFSVRPSTAVASAVGGKGYLLCEKFQDVPRTEKWFEIVDPAAGPPTLQGDITNRNESPWTILFRGPAALRNLKQQLGDTTTGIVFHNIRPWTASVNESSTDKDSGALIQGTSFSDPSDPGLSQALFRDGGIFPGVFEAESVVESFQSGWTASKLSKEANGHFEGAVDGAVARKQIPSRKVKAGDQEIQIPDIETEATKAKVLQWLRRANAAARCVAAEYARRCTVEEYLAHHEDLQFCFREKKKRWYHGLYNNPGANAADEQKAMYGECRKLASEAFP